MKQKKIAIQFIFIGMIFLLFFTLSCSKTTKSSSIAPKSRSELMLGTVSTISIYDNPSETAFNSAFKRIDEIEQKMSVNIASSEVVQINKNSGIKATPVSEDTYKVIKEAIRIAKLSNGAFDPTIGPVVKAWDIGGDAPRRPPQEELDQLLSLVGYEKVELDDETRSVKLLEKGMQLDLGGIAKGYAADAVAASLRENGVKRAIINLGGNVLVMDQKTDNDLWRIGIQNPEEQRGGHVAILYLNDKTLVTSGPYERYFVLDDIVYHHILDTTNGYPVITDLTSVSIITDESMVADGLSSAVYSLGLEKGMALVDSLDNVEALFLDVNENIYLSQGLKDGTIEYTISNPKFKVMK
jgi:thiamine biosynthesis lipoprotein